jgi:pantothenate kinase-related protein Tda10
MFRVFGKAIRKSLTEFWDSKNDTERDKIIKDAGIGFLKEKDKKFFKNNDFLPNFDNIVFIEGIAGSGKSTGVLITLSKLLAKTNPDLVDKKIFIAHTDKVKSNTLGETTEFTNFEAHDHDSLLQYMSPDYKSNM